MFLGRCLTSHLIPIAYILRLKYSIYSPFGENALNGKQLRALNVVAYSRSSGIWYPLASIVDALSLPF